MAARAKRAADGSTGSPSRILLSCLALALASLLLLCGSASAKAPRGALYWGAQIGDQLTGEQAPWDMNAVRKFEQLLGKGLSIVSFSSPFADCVGTVCTYYSFPTTPMEDVRAYGAIPMLSWNSTSSPERVPQPAFQLRDLIAGRHDAYIREFATSAKEWGHPFFLRFNWEMNGFWFPWSEGVNGNRRGELVAAWRHVHKLFSAVGATNATWVWCPNVDFTRKLRRLEALYPGRRYVDWTCLDGFNWGKRPDSAGWMGFDAIFRSTYRRVLAVAPDKPVMIGEVASNDRGGSKPGWIRNMFKTLRRYRKVHALLWFDVNDRNTHWPLERSRRASRAFARGIANPLYVPNVFSGIATDPIPPPSPLP